MAEKRLRNPPGPWILVLIFCLFPPLLARASAQFVEAGRDAVSPPHAEGGIPVPRKAVPAPLPPEEELLCLREQERALLEYFGPDYYQVQNVRARIKAIGDFIAAKKNEERKTENSGDQGNIKVGSGQIKIAKREAARTEDSRGKALPAAVENEEEESGPVRVAATQPPEAPAGATENNVLATRAERRASEGESWGGSSGNLWGTLTFRHVVAVIVGLLLGIVIQFAIFLWLLHRFTSRFSPLTRVEVAIPSSMAPSQSVEREAAEARDNRGAVVSGALAENKLLAARIQTCRPRAMSEAATPTGALDNVGDALVQELCQQNVWLREQINQLETVAA